VNEHTGVATESFVITQLVGDVAEEADAVGDLESRDSIAERDLTGLIPTGKEANVLQDVEALDAALLRVNVEIPSAPTIELVVIVSLRAGDVLRVNRMPAPSSIFP